MAWGALWGLAGLVVGLVLGWLVRGGAGKDPGTRRRPATDPGVGIAEVDAAALDAALGTENVDPASWGKIRMGPLTEEDVAEIAGRVRENRQTQADAATLLLELKRIRLKGQ